MNTFEEIIWLRLFFADVEPAAWEPIARRLYEGYPLHFFALPITAVPARDREAAAPFARRYPAATLCFFAHFIVEQGGDCTVTDDTSEPTVAYLVVRCRNQSSYRRIRKALYQGYPGITRRSQQLVGLVTDDEGTLLGCGKMVTDSVKTVVHSGGSLWNAKSVAAPTSSRTDGPRPASSSIIAEHVVSTPSPMPVPVNVQSKWRWSNSCIVNGSRSVALPV